MGEEEENVMETQEAAVPGTNSEIGQNSQRSGFNQRQDSQSSLHSSFRVQETPGQNTENYQDGDYSTASDDEQEDEEEDDRGVSSPLIPIIPNSNNNLHMIVPDMEPVILQDRRRRSTSPVGRSINYVPLITDTQQENENTLTEENTSEVRMVSVSSSGTSSHSLNVDSVENESSSSKKKKKKGKKK